MQHDDLAFFDDRSQLKSRILLALYRSIARICLRLPLRVLANSHWTADRFQSYTRRTCHVVTPGINTQLFSPRIVRDGPGHEAQIVCVGKKARWKGLPEVLAAVQSLFDLGSKLSLTIVTKDELDLGTVSFPVRIVHPATDEELRDLYCAAHVFVSASLKEGFALPPLEAMACGVPVVLTDSGGPREYAVDGFNCLMVPPGDPAALAEAIQKFLNDRSLAARLASNARATALRFDSKRMGEQLDQIFANPFNFSHEVASTVSGGRQ